MKGCTIRATIGKGRSEVKGIGNEIISFEKQEQDHSKKWVRS